MPYNVKIVGIIHIKLILKNNNIKNNISAIELINKQPPAIGIIINENIINISIKKDKKNIFNYLT
jgi:hypothetical protein